ncbi:MAG: hypothetical protein HYV75_06860 [Opitutae bacterium]|nr:hypothetical protein [Opitutae bacterium]
MKYLALIGDIVDSKGLPKRGEFQTELAAGLKEISSRNPALVSPYTITLGDEFQAVYKSADTLFADIFSILRRIHPVRARFAVGVGGLSTEINRKQALGMDGPAFHRAREAMNELKASRYLIRLQGAPAGDSAADPWKLLNHLLNLVTYKIGGWEGNRLRIIQGLLNGESVAVLEKELRISNVAVYKNINAAALDELQGLCEEMTRLLNDELKTP